MRITPMESRAGIWRGGRPLCRQCALAIVPPAVDWEPIQAIRRRHDPFYGQILPHISLLYPFWESAFFDEAAERLLPLLETIEPFRLTLQRAGCFADPNGGYFIWLGATPQAPLLKLEKQLLGLFPGCDQQARHRTGFVPHLTVGHAADDAEAAAQISAILARWEPMELRVDRLSMNAAPEGEVQIERTLALGSP